MSFSPFDRRLLSEGLAFFDRPRLAELLEALGDSEYERIETLVAMLLSGSEDETQEAVKVFERALARVEREQDRTQDRDRNGRGGRRRRRREGPEG